MIFRESYIQPLTIHHPLFFQMITTKPYIPPPTSSIFQIICAKSYIPLCWNLALSGFWNSFRLSDCQTLVIYWLEESHLRRRCFRGWNWGGVVQIGVKLKRPPVYDDKLHNPEQYWCCSQRNSEGKIIHQIGCSCHNNLLSLSGWYINSLVCFGCS